MVDKDRNIPLPPEAVQEIVRNAFSEATGQDVVVRPSPLEVMQAMTRDENIMDVANRGFQELYQETLIDGDANGEFDPIAIVAVAPSFLPDGRIHIDLTDFIRPDNPLSEQDYFRRISSLNLDGCTFQNIPAERISSETGEEIDIDTQTVMTMNELTASFMPSAVLVFSNGATPEGSVHLFTPIFMSPAEALDQLHGLAKAESGEGLKEINIKV